MHARCIAAEMKSSPSPMVWLALLMLLVNIVTFLFDVKILTVEILVYVYQNQISLYGKIYLNDSI